jgi:hypothetical protein
MSEVPLGRAHASLLTRPFMDIFLTETTLIFTLPIRLRAEVVRPTDSLELLTFK